ncbi:MAG: lysylphosphatidylglycerol synthase domain-containing protein [Novosphingobium sp.]
MEAQPHLAPIPDDAQPLLARWRRPLAFAAAILFLASLAYVATFIARNRAALEHLPPLRILPLAASAALYLLAHPFTSAAWVIGLRSLGQDIRFDLALKIAFASQVGKYLPGNVAHYFGRAALARFHGVTLKGSGIATLLEIVAALLAAALVASAAMLLDPAPLVALSSALSKASALPALVALAALGGAAVFLRFARIPVSVLAKVTACLAANFVLVGLSLLAVVAAVSAQSLSPAAAIGIFAVAWTAGYLLPGAPAGLGIREAILVAWLSPIIGPGAAIACTVLHRIITAGVDALVGIGGYGWLRAENQVRSK